MWTDSCLRAHGGNGNLVVDQRHSFRLSLDFFSNGNWTTSFISEGVLHESENVCVLLGCALILVESLIGPHDLETFAFVLSLEVSFFVLFVLPSIVSFIFRKPLIVVLPRVSVVGDFD